jgi:hypothetical protein
MSFLDRYVISIPPQNWEGVKQCKNKKYKGTVSILLKN